jgi:hypothetical protein
MFFLFELAVILAVFVYGCRTKRIAFFFLPIIAAAFASLGFLFGNPIGLLTSLGGWIILDVMLALAALLADLAGQYQRVRTPIR